MKLSIIIPCYNEEKTILEVLRRIEHVPFDHMLLDYEIIVVDDGSVDGTKGMIENYASGKNNVFVYSKENEGKGSAVRKGLELATGDIFLIQDADLEYDPADYPALLEPILNGNAKVVYGTRLISGIRHRYFLHYIGNKFLTWFFRLLFGTNVTDMETGYKVFTKEVANKIKLAAKGFEIEPEITAQIIKNGFYITEVPISFKGRSFEEGKKISWKDGIKACYYLIKYRFFSRDQKGN